MKKAIRIVAITLCSVVLLCGITAIILTAIVIRPLEQLDGYQQVRVVAYAGDSGQDATVLYRENKDSVKFRLITAFFSGNLSYKIANVEVADVDDIDNDDDVDEMTALKHPAVSPNSSEVFSQVSKPTSEQFGILFDYGFDGARTNDFFKDENGNKIVYDRVLMVIPKANQGIQEVKLFPFYTENLVDNSGTDVMNEAGIIKPEYYTVYEFVAKMYTSDLYDALVDGEFSTGVNS